MEARVQMVFTVTNLDHLVRTRAVLRQIRFTNQREVPQTSMLMETCKIVPPTHTII